MTKRKTSKANKAAGTDPLIVAMADKLGRLLGRATKRASGVLTTGKKKVAAKKASKAKSRGSKPAEAPARRLRKPPPEELFDPRLGEPMGKQMGQKSVRRSKGER